jgi:phenylpropionate dioxygenase-like ring-hydroxylating dioxygenase large terminal subunit
MHMQSQPQSQQPAARSPEREWAAGDLTRVPYWIYQDPDVYAEEQRRIYQGPVWNFLCLESELKQPGDFITTFIGEMPVVVARGRDGQIHGFENRCSHRGALISLENSGNVKAFSCVYHGWGYDLQGTLRGIAFQNGVEGRGGMPKSFVPKDHSPRKLRIANLSGLIFGSLSEEVPAIEDYLGPEITAKVRRVFYKPTRILGRFTQALPNNWKLYFENVKDSYHATLLHLFLPTFNISRLTNGGGLLISEDGGSHVSYALTDPEADGRAEYKEQGLRTDSQYRLRDPSFMKGIPEFGDNITPQILSIFPGFVIGQVENSVVVRQVLPKGVCRTHLNWTYIGFEGDDAEMSRRRMRQCNLIGPAGFISMEDGAVGGFVERGIAAAGGLSGVLEMGGSEASTTNTRATEAAVRGFWKAYRGHMGL